MPSTAGGFVCIEHKGAWDTERQRRILNGMKRTVFALAAVVALVVPAAVGAKLTASGAEVSPAAPSAPAVPYDEPCNGHGAATYADL
jgi:hypothetical protein